MPRLSEVGGGGEKIYLRNVLPYRTENKRIEGVVVTFTEITERKRAEQEVQVARQFAESIVDTVREPLLVLTPDLRVRSANASFYRTYHVKPEGTVDRLIYELGEGQWDIPELRRLLEEVLRDNQQFDDFEVERDFGTIGRHTMLLNARRLEQAQLILLAIEDVTERKRAEEHKDLLLSELSHRVKNTLAVVQARAMQTDGNSSVEAFRQAFTGRLQVLARAHSLLLDQHWQGADLRVLVEQVLEPYQAERSDRIALEGEAVTLIPSHGVALSLILHEMATNAAKYGALACDEGRVDLSWQVRPGSALRVHLRWQERGGPPVEPPRAAGFGTRLIERAVSHELQGQLELDYAPDGLSCEIVFRLS